MCNDIVEKTCNISLHLHEKTDQENPLSEI